MRFFFYNVNDNFLLTADNLIAINLVETIRTTQLLSTATYNPWKYKSPCLKIVGIPTR